MLQRTQQIQIHQITGCCSVPNRYRCARYLDAAAYATDTDMAHTWMLQRTQQIQYRYGTYLDAAAYSTDTDMTRTWMLQRTEQIQIQN